MMNLVPNMYLDSLSRSKRIPQAEATKRVKDLIEKFSNITKEELAKGVPFAGPVVVMDNKGVGEEGRYSGVITDILHVDGEPLLLKTSSNQLIALQDYYKL